jgi:hypothetical protein
VASWRTANERAIARTGAMFTEIRRAERFDITVLSVALRQLRNLALTTHRPTRSPHPPRTAAFVSRPGL